MTGFLALFSGIPPLMTRIAGGFHAQNVRKAEPVFIARCYHLAMILTLSQVTKLKVNVSAPIQLFWWQVALYSISRFCCAFLVVVMQSFIMNSHEVFIHIHQGCFAGTGAIVRLPQCQWSKPDGYGKISQCITTTKHSKTKPCAYFLGYTVVWVQMSGASALGLNLILIDLSH